jgi:hypothetical protein
MDELYDLAFRVGSSAAELGRVHALVFAGQGVPLRDHPALDVDQVTVAGMAMQRLDEALVLLRALGAMIDVDLPAGPTEPPHV